MDWESKEDHVIFTEDDIVLNGLQLNVSSCIIYDIKKYDMRTKQVAHYGYAFYPFVQAFQNRVYLISGLM